jgi:hypothetical protein
MVRYRLSHAAFRGAALSLALLGGLVECAALCRARLSAQVTALMRV